MVLLWMILLVVLLCAQAENVAEVRGQLGTEVTLTCSGQSSEIHWYMEIHSQLRGCIGRSFPTEPKYCSPEFKTKFSLVGNRLMIKNLTAEDCRLYFCGIRRNDSTQFVNTFHLVSDAALLTSCMSQLVLIISVSVATLIGLIMGGVLMLLCLRRKNSSKQVEEPSVHIYENAETLWAMQGKVIQYQARHH